MIGIYKITNPKGKIYIGQTINWKSRKHDYKLLNCVNQRKLYNSLIKYGWINHIFELIEECNVESLNTKERYWQEYYNVLEEGLNLKLTQTEDKSGFTSNETKKLISSSMKEKNTWSKGGYFIKPILQYDLQGNFIKKWNSIEEAKRKNNWKTINIKGKTSHGFLWFFENEFNNEILNNKINQPNKNKNKKKSLSHSLKIKNMITEVNKKKRKPILQYDLKENFIQEWESILKAAKTLNLRSCGISNNIAGRTKFCGNFIWRYK